MAYVLPTEDEEREQRQSGQAKPAGGGAVLGGGMQSPRPASAVSGSPQPAKTSTNFVSYDRVLGANKDAAKAYSQKMTQPLQAQAQKAQQGIATAQAAFNQAAQAGTPKPVKPAAPATAAGKGQTADAYLYQQEALKKQAATQAAQAYTGPESMSAMTGWEDLVGGVKDAQRQTGLAGQRSSTGELQGDAGLQTLLEEQVSGPYTKGQSKMDAALMGSTGRSKWEELSAQYGDLLGEANRANEASKATAAGAKAAVAGQPNLAQQELDRVAAENKATADANKAKTDAYQGWRDGLFLTQGEGKAQDWKTYNETNRFENTLGDIGEAFDPVSWGVKAGGGPSHHVAARDAMDGQMNKMGGTVNSNKVNWGMTGQFGAMPENVKSSVYNSLSAEELHALERMGDGDAHAFVMKRVAQLGKEAAQTLSDPKFAGKSDSEIFHMLVTQYGIDPYEATSLFMLRDEAKRLGLL